MRTSSLLLFDLGGVLVENVVFDRLAQRLPKLSELSVLKDRWLMSAAVRSFELGEISPPQFAESFLEKWGLELSPQDFLKEFESWPTGFYPGALDVLGFLRRHHRLACLSNSNVLHWHKFNGFADQFDPALSSHLLGAVKPDVDIFVRALERCGCDPHSIWFFDDSTANVRTARSVGFRAFHTDGITSLVEVLRAEGLLPVEGLAPQSTEYA